MPAKPFNQLAPDFNQTSLFSGDLDTLRQSGRIAAIFPDSNRGGEGKALMQPADEKGL